MNQYKILNIIGQGYGIVDLGRSAMRIWLETWSRTITTS